MSFYDQPFSPPYPPDNSDSFGEGRMYYHGSSISLHPQPALHFQPFDTDLEPGPTITITEPGTVFRIAGMGSLLPLGVFNEYDRNIGLQVVNTIGLGGRSEVCQVFWVKNSTGSWVITPDQAPMVVKISRTTSETISEGYLNEYETAQAVWEVTRRSRSRMVVEPSMVGLMNVWTPQGWLLSDISALVMPMHLPLYTYLERNIRLDRLGCIGEIFHSTIEAMTAMHDTGYIHGDAKADNVVVRQSWRWEEGTFKTYNEALLIDFEGTRRREEGVPLKHHTGTPGFMSLGYLSSHFRRAYKEKRTKYKELWKTEDEPEILQHFFGQAAKGYSFQDDLFGIGVSMVRALAAHKKQKHNLKEPYRLSFSKDYSSLKEFFSRPVLGKWSDLETILVQVANSYRATWERREYEEWLGEEYEAFYEVLSVCFRKSTWNIFDSCIETKSDPDTKAILSKFLIAMKTLVEVEAETEEATKVEDYLDLEGRFLLPCSGKAKALRYRPTHLKARSIGGQPNPRAPQTLRYPISGEWERPKPYPTPPRRSQSVDSRPGSSNYLASPTSHAISAEDIGLLYRGDDEPFRLGRVKVSRVSKSQMLASWQVNEGIIIPMACGNYLVPQIDGGYLQEVQMIGHSDKVSVHVYTQCGEVGLYVCNMLGCGRDDAAPSTFTSVAGYRAHYHASDSPYRCEAAKASEVPLKITETSEADDH